MTKDVLDEVRVVLEASRALGYLGPGPVVEHVDHALGFEAALRREPAASVVDLGSGGGLPALVLAARSDASFALIDRSARRCAFLEWAVDELSLGGRVVVIEGDAEDVARLPQYEGTADVVTARSFGPPAVTGEAAARHLASGGRLIVSEPPGASAGVRWHHGALAQLGLRFEDVLSHNGASFAVLRRTDRELADRYPRRSSSVRKRPLF